jgi:hypothetical protein
MSMLRNVMLAGVAVLGITATSPAFADRATLVVVTEDHDPETVPRHNRIYKRVQAALIETLNVKNFDIYDETAACMEITEPNRIRRIDAELISVARACASPAIPGMRPRPPIDGLVIWTMYASAEKIPHTPDIFAAKVRIEGRVLDVRTGQHLGGFEVGGFPLPPLPAGCQAKRECLLEFVGNSTRLIAEGLGQALGDKLDAFHKTSVGGPAGPAGAPVGPDGCLGRTQNFVLTFTGFSPPEMTQAEESMVRFSCYHTHRPLAADPGRVQYYYETQTDEARLFRNLRILMDYLGVRGSVTKTATGEYLIA